LTGMRTWTDQGEKRRLREFGVTVGIGFGVLAGLLFWRQKGHYVYFIGFSGVFFLLGLVVPFLLRPVYKVWMKGSAAMGWFMTRVILTLLFFVVFTSIAVIARLVGKRFLQLEMDEQADTYWVYKVPGEPSGSNYERQF
jgi:hypothetical protein